MPIALKANFSVAADPAELLFDFAAYPGGRAIAVLHHRTDQTYSLARFERELLVRAKIDGAMVSGLDESPHSFHRAVFCRVGSGFAVVSPKAAALWRTLDSEPQRFDRVDAFPRNEHGFTVEVSKGGGSDDPTAALVLLHDPQVIDSITRYALLRFDEARAECRWEWVNSGGDPPWLARDDFPIPVLLQQPSDTRTFARPILYNGDWRGGHLRLFTVGLTSNFERWGMDYSIDAEISNGRAAIGWTCDEDCFGAYTSSGRYLILNPLRPKGPIAGASRLLDLETRELHAITLPRGCAKFLVADHVDRMFWLKPRRGEPLRVVACRAA
jgi:hypothetical protein